MNSLDPRLTTLNQQPFCAVRFLGDCVDMLDQRVLPHKVEYIRYYQFEDLAQAITDMVVRGAPAIGIAAAYGVVLAAKQQSTHLSLDLTSALSTLAASRPTAVNLFWALKKMEDCWKGHSALPVDEQIRKLEHLAIEIHQQDVDNNLKMGELGASLIQANSQVYTHCNAGALATGGHGTALGVIRSAHALGKIQHVYAGETRPWWQGSRLTAWELMQDRIPVTLSTEGAVGQLFRQGHIQWVIVGADRIAANGDVANKVGTYNLAVIAKHHGIKVMVVAPTSTFDWQLSSGDDIPIEHRPMEEVTHAKGDPIAPLNCQAINPSFDVTPHTLIDAIVCEAGIINQPNDEAMSALKSTLDSSESDA